MAHHQQYLNASSRTKYQSAAGHETPAPNPARSRKEANVTIYDMIQSKAQEILAMPQVEYGAKFYVWDSQTLRIFLEANEGLKVWAMAPVGATPSFPWRVVAWSTLIAWETEYSFTQAEYRLFVKQIQAASVRLFGTRR